METCRGLPSDPDAEHTRYTEAAVNGVLIGCLYLPNENPAVGSRFDYKLRWFDRLGTPAAELLATGMPVVLAGSPARPGRGRFFRDRQATAGDERAAHQCRASVRHHSDPDVSRAARSTPQIRRRGLELAFNSLACEAFINGQPYEGWSCLPQPYDDRERLGIL